MRKVIFSVLSGALLAASATVGAGTSFAGDGGGLQPAPLRLGASSAAQQDDGRAGVTGRSTTATGAAAATSCSGSKIGTFTKSGVPLRLDVYYNSSTGNNCATATHTGSAYGVAAPTTLYLDRCSTGNTNSACNIEAYVSDFGDYRYYAGPVSLYAKDRCIRVSAYITWGGKSLSVASYGASDTTGQFCG